MNKVGYAAVIGHEGANEGCEGRHNGGRITPYTHQEKLAD